MLCADCPRQGYLPLAKLRAVCCGEAARREQVRQQAATSHALQACLPASGRLDRAARRRLAKLQRKAAMR